MQTQQMHFCATIAAMFVLGGADPSRDPQPNLVFVLVVSAHIWQSQPLHVDRVGECLDFGAMRDATANVCSKGSAMLGYAG